MSKFKIIETGRILTSDELKDVQGGFEDSYSAHICIDITRFRACDSSQKLVCGGGFVIVPCVADLTCPNVYKHCVDNIKTVCRDGFGIQG